MLGIFFLKQVVLKKQQPNITEVSYSEVEADSGFYEEVIGAFAKWRWKEPCVFAKRLPQLQHQLKRSHILQDDLSACNFSLAVFMPTICVPCSGIFSSISSPSTWS